jgi:hypothetical protein
MIVAARQEGKYYFIAERQSGRDFDCRAGWRPSRAFGVFDGGAASIRFDVHLQDCRVMNEPIDGGEVSIRNAPPCERGSAA